MSFWGQGTQNTKALGQWLKLRATLTLKRLLAVSGYIFGWGRGCLCHLGSGGPGYTEQPPTTKNNAARIVGHASDEKFCCKMIMHLFFSVVARRLEGRDLHGGPGRLSLRQRAQWGHWREEVARHEGPRSLPKGLACPLWECGELCKSLQQSSDRSLHVHDRITARCENDAATWATAEGRRGQPG